MKNFDPEFQGTFSGSITLDTNSSISASYALTASYALNAGSGGGSGSYTLTNTDIAGLQVGIISSSQQVSASAAAENFMTSASAASLGFGSGGGSGIASVVADTTPQLGGNLDINGNNISGSGNIDISGSITANEFVTGESAVGSPTLLAANNLNLSASGAVVVQKALFRLGKLENSETGSYVAADGDLIYNTDRKKFMGYSGSEWHEITLS